MNIFNGLVSASSAAAVVALTVLGVLVLLLVAAVLFADNDRPADRLKCLLEPCMPKRRKGKGRQR